MKYKYGMIVYYIKDKTAFMPDAYQIMGYDEKRQKYICLTTDECCYTEQGSTILDLISEVDLDLYENYNKEMALLKKEFYNKVFPKDTNLYYFSLYEKKDDYNDILIRNAILGRSKIN